MISKVASDKKRYFGSDFKISETLKSAKKAGDSVTNGSLHLPFSAGLVKLQLKADKLRKGNLQNNYWPRFFASLSFSS